MKYKRIKNKKETDNKEKIDCYIIEAKEKEARAIIDSLQKRGYKGKIAVIGGENANNRRAIETLKINYLISPERGTKKDTLKQRDSGLNHVITKEATKKGIIIVIDIEEVSSIKDKKEKAKRIARIIQNIKICRKTKTKIKIISFNEEFSKEEIMAFGNSLGMSSSQTKSAIIQ